MAAAGKKKLFINSIELISFDGHEFFPSVLMVTKDEVLYGHKAVATAQQPSDLNIDFKVSLGYVDPTGSVHSRQRFETAGGEKKSAFELSKTFIESALKDSASALQRGGAAPADKILVCEPFGLLR